MQTKDAQVESTVVRGIGANQACQFAHIWLSWACDVACPLRRHVFVGDLQGFEDTSFAVVTVASAAQLLHRLPDGHVRSRLAPNWPNAMFS
ncbi:MAG TPA: hypothetical protein VEP50_06945 [bacterium]|nr:hypothetical protein [bacterium]